MISIMKYLMKYKNYPISPTSQNGQNKYKYGAETPNSKLPKFDFQNNTWKTSNYLNWTHKTEQRTLTNDLIHTNKTNI